MASFEHTLVADVADRAELARIVRVALARDVARVPLTIAPRSSERTMLQLRIGGVPACVLAAETIGAPGLDGWPLRLAPLDPTHVSELEAIVDELPPSLAPLSKSESAIFDSKPPLPSAPRTVFDPPREEEPPSDDEPLGGSVLFDPESALAARPSHRPPAVTANRDDTLTVPHRPSMGPPQPPTERDVSEEWKKTDPSATNDLRAAAHAALAAQSARQAHPADEDGISVVFGDEKTLGAETQSPVVPPVRTEVRAEMEVGLTPTEPFPPQDLTEWRRKQALGLAVNEDTGTLPSSQSGDIRSTAQMSRGPRTQRRQFPVIGVGRIIGNKYRIEAHIGSGAVGAVYRASHGDLGRHVAIKVLHPHCRADPHLLASFRAEARSASNLDHPNVTVVHDFGEDPDGTVYIVMEHLPGATLQRVLDDERRIAPKRAIAIMLQVCAALAAAHERGIVHRDVKPDNIILVQSRDDEGFPYEVAKVCDFGIAALAGPSITLQGDGELTAGTPEYMAPEQAQGRSDARTDIYACGVVLYEMLSGQPPFIGATPREILVRHAKEIPRRLSELVPIDARLEALVMRAMEKQADRRFQSMRELRGVLKKLT